MAYWRGGDSCLVRRRGNAPLCGSADFHVPYSRPLRDGLVVDSVERWARDSRIMLAHRSRLIASERIQLSLNSTVTEITSRRMGRPSRASPSRHLQDLAL